MFEHAVARQAPRKRWLKVWIAVALTLVLLIALTGVLWYGGSRGTPPPPRRTDTTVRR